MAKEDEQLLAQVRAGSATLPYSDGSDAAGTQEVAASNNNYTTVSVASAVLSGAYEGAEEIGTLNPGDQVYVYQVGSEYSMIVFNNAFGYVENAKITKEDGIPWGICSGGFHFYLERIALYMKLSL